MGTPAAERQRRSRAHRRGDHSLCDSSRCDDGVTVTDSVTVPAKARGPELDARGRRLWQQVADEGPGLRPAERVLLEEACRTVDRLDRLDRMLRGDEAAWARFHSVNEDGSIVQVVINNLLSEARQQQVTLKQLLGELRQSRAPGKPTGQSATPAAGKGVAGVLDLTARIAQLRDQSAG